MGRWQSGVTTNISLVFCVFPDLGMQVPIDRHPKVDVPSEAEDVDKVNNFDYLGDLNQVRCPFAAHLRKMNPRRSAVPGLDHVQPHRITRQGIPYGPEVGEDEATTTKNNRGLFFVRGTCLVHLAGEILTFAQKVCYQSSLKNGFHFLQRGRLRLSSYPTLPDCEHLQHGLTTLTSLTRVTDSISSCAFRSPRSLSASEYGE